MNEQYLNAAKAINEVALFFATEGYHTTTAFGSGCHSLEVCIFFYDIDEKRKIRRFLKSHSEKKDEIEFNDFSHEGRQSFYTLKLKKYIL